MDGEDQGGVGHSANPHLRGEMWGTRFCGDSNVGHPPMEAGLAGHVWSMQELVGCCKNRCKIDRSAMELQNPPSFLAGWVDCWQPLSQGIQNKCISGC